MTASLTHGARAIEAQAFTFVSCNADIASRLGDFMPILRDRLVG